MSRKVKVFDFDGVLGVPWTHPEQPFPQVKEGLQKLHDAGFKLLLASYNPNVQVVMNRWGVRHLFSGIRARSNQRWEQDDKKNYNDEIHGKGMSKALQIVDMLKEELNGEYSLIDCTFIDDDQINLDLVNQELPEVETFLITDFYEGLTECHIEQMLTGQKLTQAPLLPSISFFKLRMAFDFLEKIQKIGKPEEVNGKISFQQLNQLLTVLEETQARGQDRINDELVELGKLAKLAQPKSV